MTKQEFIEWAMEDILVSLDENTDIIVSWLVGSKRLQMSCDKDKLMTLW